MVMCKRCHRYIGNRTHHHFCNGCWHKIKNGKPKVVTMGKLIPWIVVGVIIFGVMVYANPQLWEDIKMGGNTIFGETIEVNSRVECNTMYNFVDLGMEDVGDQIMRRGCEDICPAKTTKYSGSYKCDVNSGFIMCSCKITQEGKQLVEETKQRIAEQIDSSVYMACWDACYTTCKYNKAAELPSGYSCQCVCGDNGVPEQYIPVKIPEKFNIK